MKDILIERNFAICKDCGGSMALYKHVLCDEYYLECDYCPSYLELKNFSRRGESEENNGV